MPPENGWTLALREGLASLPAATRVAASDPEEVVMSASRLPAASTPVTEVRREDDDELLGFTAPTDSGWQALTVFGGVLGEHPTEDDALQQVRAQGLASLAEKWWVDVGEGWQACHLIEASPDRLVAVIAPYPWLERPRPVPADAPLRLHPPA